MSENWTETLSEELSSNPTIQNIPDVETLAKSYVDAQSYIGGAVRIPSEDAGDEARTEFYDKLQSVPGVVRIPGEDDTDGMEALWSRLGRPEDPQGYGIQTPEGLEASQEMLDGFSNIAHQAGLTTEQAQAIAGWWNNSQMTTMQENEQVQQQAVGELQQEWGMAFDQKLQEAQAAVNAYGGDELKAFLDQTGMGNNPALIRAFAKIGSQLGEDSSAAVGRSSNQFAVTPADAKDRISDIMNNPAHPYHNVRSPDHRDAVDKMSRLFEAAHPEAPE